MKNQTLRWLIPIIPAVSDQVMAEKPIDGPLEVSICCQGGSKLAKLPFVMEIEHFWHQRHFWREIIINWVSFW